MRDFAGYKDKRAFIKRAPGATADRFFLGFLYEIGFLSFRRVVGVTSVDPPGANALEE